MGKWGRGGWPSCWNTPWELGLSLLRDPVSHPSHSGLALPPQLEPPSLSPIGSSHPAQNPAAAPRCLLGVVASRCLGHLVCRGFLQGSLLVPSLVPVKGKGPGWGETRPGQPGFSDCSQLCVCSLGLVGGNSLHKDRKAEVLCGKGKAAVAPGTARGSAAHRGLGRGTTAEAPSPQHRSPL